MRSDDVSKLKRHLDSLCISGMGSRLRGIIVTSELWQALKDDDPKFEGVLDVSGEYGNRQIRYRFYVLENPNFSKQGPERFFPVPYTKEVYQARFLGKEDDILRETSDSKVQIGSHTISLYNEIKGVLGFGRRFILHVDCQAVLSAFKAKSPKDRQDYLHRLMVFGEINNPPQTTWMHRPLTYDYHRAQGKWEVGRLYMRRRESEMFDIVGMAINPYKQIVPIVIPGTAFQISSDFAEVAVQYFLPEEVSDFLCQFPLTPSAHYMDHVHVREQWQSKHDPEDLGRLRPFNNPTAPHISATFLTTRGWSTSADLPGINDRASWRRMRARHFPQGWNGWPHTREERAIVRSLRSSESLV